MDPETAPSTFTTAQVNQTVAELSEHVERLRDGPDGLAVYAGGLRASREARP